ncbi:MAG: class I SAM-dependent methyltransferase [Pseudomonadota bacterium]
MSYARKQVIPFYEGRIGSWQIKIDRLSLDVSELSKRFDRLAKAWHAMLRRLGYHAAYEDLWERLLGLSSLPLSRSHSPNILDCGAGTGSFSAAFARAWASPVKVSGVDASPGMLSEAETLYAQQGIKADLRCADTRSLPYLDNEFDLVMTAHVLEHLVNPKVALREMKRVLKPGGWLVVGVTRDSLLGRYIHFKWRTHLFKPAQLAKWIDSEGLNVLDEDIPLRGLFGKTSLVCVCQKPLTAEQIDHDK